MKLLRKTRSTVLVITILSYAAIFATPALRADEVSLEKSEKDEGYFLSFGQMMELVWSGEITDAKGNIYDVWVCPGYKYPALWGKKYWTKSGKKFGEYFGSEKYEDFWDTFSDVFEWVGDDCIAEYIIEDSGEAWSKRFNKASDRVGRRVFGWQMAYPVATVSAAGETLFRFTTGIIGAALGSAAGVTVVPLYYALDSGSVGTTYALFPGTLAPIGGWTWNTLATPPMALFGQRPSPERVDGFWVVIRTPQDIMLENPNMEMVAKLADACAGLIPELKNFDEQKKQIDDEICEEFLQIRKRRESDFKALEDKRAKYISENVDRILIELEKSGIEKPEEALLTYWKLITKRLGEEGARFDHVDAIYLWLKNKKMEFPEPTGHRPAEERIFSPDSIKQVR